MRNILCCLTMILMVGCAGQPTSPAPEPAEAELPKASSPSTEGGTTVYRGAAPTAIKASPAPSAPKNTEGKSCKTPLGTIPDGGKATGYLQATVPPGEICISDTITCNNGVWTGQAIHPTCKTAK